MLHTLTVKKLWLVAILVILTVCMVLGSFQTTNVLAASAQTHPRPPVDWSFYMSDNNQQRAKTLGQNQGMDDASHNANSEVILDFGAQDSNFNGTIFPKTKTISITYADIKNMALAFAAGYVQAVRQQGDANTILHLAIGTNNSSWYPAIPNGTDTAEGQTWAQLMIQIQNDITSAGYSNRVQILGANDMEPEFSPPEFARAWAVGYASVSNTPKYLDFGSADGCPQSTPWWSFGFFLTRACANGWSQEDVWSLSWGDGWGLPVPQIYYPGQADEWINISNYGAQHYNAPLSLAGPMDEHDLGSSSFTPDQAWNAMSPVGNMTYSIEIHNEYP